MKNTKFIGLLPVVAFAFAACDSDHPAGPVAEAASESIPLFKEGKGVLFSDETKKLFGLEIADATERPVQRRLEKIAEVYRTARADQPGAALVLCSTDEAKDLSPGQPVGLRPANATGAEIAGKIVRIETQAQVATDRVEVLIEFADPAAALVAGASATATFINGDPKTVLTVPVAALLSAADGSYVYTVNGTHLTRTRVKAGAANDGFIAIDDGLYSGDAVAAKGIDNLWLVELSALKGGTPCCPVPKKEAAK